MADAAAPAADAAADAAAPPPTATAAADASLTAVLRFEAFADTQLTLLLFKDVPDAPQLRQLLASRSGAQQRDMALLDAAMIPGVYHVHVAAHKALEQAQLTARSLHGELVYQLGGSTHVSECFKRCGVSETTRHVLAALFNASPQDVAEAAALVKGTQVPLEQLGGLQQPDAIQKAFKLNAEEVGLQGGLEAAVLAKVAARDC